MKYIFTLHAIYRTKQRKITEEEVIEAIKTPDKIQKRYNKYYVQKNVSKGVIEIVYEKTENYIKIITVYWL